MLGEAKDLNRSGITDRSLTENFNPTIFFSDSYLF
jgi:hypothetical protein